MHASEAVQQQLKDDWDNREFEQVSRRKKMMEIDWNVNENWLKMVVEIFEYF